MLKTEEVTKLAKLAGIELTPDEEIKFATEISAILGFVNQLQNIKVFEELESNEICENVLRTDRVIGISSAEQADLISQAPEIQGNLIKTKPVF
ncbi:MAG: Asp-tRNA(Asn)/Glu-tRNA(Gln) amidotransferase subunit GatC [Candidatus Komeilibacteria bacterium]|nr:Asp-tRNA(Asn)/Glu-tRNA(Gln) amidotransferase subunit GatC [Candidatus Komeilibacteria bacterium]